MFSDLRAKGLSGYIISWTISTEYSQVVYWNYLQLYGHLLLTEDEVDITSTGRYYDDVDINQWNSYSRLVTYKSFQQDNFFVRCRHRPMFVNTKGHATH